MPGLEVEQHAAAEALAAPPVPAPKAGSQQLRDALLENHLIVFLVMAFVVGLSAPSLGSALSRPKVDLGPAGQSALVSFVLLVVIFLISGFRLKTDAVLGAIQSPRPLLVAMILILAVTPLVGFAVLAIPWQTKELGYGLTVFCCVPTTLTSGAALISGGKGTERATELALLVTVATNLLGSFTMPLMLKLILSEADVSFNATQLLAKLVLAILFPTLLGKLLCDLIPGAAAVSKDWKTPLTVLSNLCLCSIVWMTVSTSQGVIVEQPAGAVALCVACGIGLHFVFWIVAAPLVTCAQIQDLHHSRAVFLLAAQKTLPVSVAVISGLPASFGQAGLITLPCIFGHLSQLFVDSCIVNRWSQNIDEPLFPFSRRAAQS